MRGSLLLGHHLALFTGFLTGGLLFILLSLLVNDFGGVKISNT